MTEIKGRNIKKIGMGKKRKKRQKKGEKIERKKRENLSKNGESD